MAKRKSRAGRYTSRKAPSTSIIKRAMSLERKAMSHDRKMMSQYKREHRMDIFLTGALVVTSVVSIGIWLFRKR